MSSTKLEVVENEAEALPAVIVDKLVKEMRLKDGKKLRVLDEVSFEVPVGSKTAIIGPSGCGKTVLLKVLCTIYIPDGGEARIFGLDIVKNSGKVRKMVSFISPSLDFHKKLTLDETLRFFAKVQRSDVEPAYRFLSFIKMDGLEKRLLEGFSEGQKAAVRLAIGLMKRPRLLLLDEPTANLDIARKELVVDFLQKELSETTVIMVDHDPKVVTRLCDRVVLMKAGGKVVKSGDARNILKDFPFKYQFSIKALLKTQFSKRILEDLGCPFQQTGKIVRFFLSTKDGVKELADKLIERRGLLSFEVSHISMEDIYYWLAGQLEGFRGGYSSSCKKA